MNPREIVEVYERLRGSRVDLWDEQALLDHLGSEQRDAVPALRALAIADRESRFVVPRVEPVVSFPESSFPTRRTRSVLTELLSGARDEILIAGYQVSEPKLILLLGEATARGVRLDLFVDHKQGSLASLKTHWPAGAGSARVWVGNLQSPRFPKASMHAKAIIADGVRALVSSANLTRNGMDANVEFGLLVEGEAVRPLREILIRLARSSKFKAEVIDRRPID